MSAVARQRTMVALVLLVGWPAVSLAKDYRFYSGPPLARGEVAFIRVDSCAIVHQMSYHAKEIFRGKRIDQAELLPGRYSLSLDYFWSNFHYTGNLKGVGRDITEYGVAIRDCPARC